jgi:hypothetical protein
MAIQIRTSLLVRTDVPKSVKPNILQIAGSVLASAFGVQSNTNYNRDFNNGSLLLYIVIGVIFVIMFVTALVLLVSTIVN